MDVQTRSEINGLKFYSSVEQAMEEAKNDSSIWKISFESFNGERIRLVKNEQGLFEYHNLLQEVMQYIEEKYGSQD